VLLATPAGSTGGAAGLEAFTHMLISTERTERIDDNAHMRRIF
jgi:hypothetical protein